MRQKTHHLYYLYYPKGWIIAALLLISAAALAQESTPDEFTVGSPIKHKLIDFPNLIDTFNTVGFNTIWQRAETFTQGLLEDYKLIALNEYSPAEYIFHYSTSYYSKWEAEQNLTGEDTARVGFKHKGGQPAFWYDSELDDTVLCWSTQGLSAPACSLMYGPHYRQEKRYKRWLYGCRIEDGCPTYTPRFRMALDNHGDADSTEDVCIIKVVFRYKNLADSLHYDTTFISRTLKVGDFNPNGDFDYFYLHPIQSLGIYEYYPGFILPKVFAQMPDSPLPVDYTDWESFTGIQFWVDWLRTDTRCTLYIDNAEVYDNDGWHEYINDPARVDSLIISYAQSFSGWDNIIYWTGPDEPFTIDSYMPMHIVDSLIRSYPTQAPPLVVHFDPNWTWDHKINGEDEIEMFYNIAKPEKIILGLYPASPNWPAIRPIDFEWLRFNFQRTSAVDSSFWFKAQTFGLRNLDSSWCIWRKPNSPELTSFVMLSLAHGAEGIIFEWFDSFPYNADPCPNTYIECLVDSLGNPEGNDGDTLYFTVKDKLAPRLKGILGNKLLSLNYTGNHLQLRRHLEEMPDFGFYNSEPSVDSLYLTLSEYTGETPPPIHFHAGFLENPYQPDNKHFLLVNLITTDNRWVNVKVGDDCSTPRNIRFRNIETEHNFDTTFTCNISIDMQFPPGEGYLFQVAPVVIYGGKLIYDETISSTTTLHDEMVIQNSAILTVNSTYNVYADIRVKAGGRIVTTGNGKINFYNGHKLIIEGNAIINGIASNKLKLDFTNPANSNGIIIRSGGSLTISYCEIKNAVKGITSELNIYNLNIQNVDFIDCDSVAVYIVGRNRLLEQLTLTPPPPQIKNCNITNSDFGILVSNLSQIVIQENHITNTDLGIYLSNVSTPAIINNILTGTGQMPGIFLESCNGIVRGNSVIGFSNGLTLGHSSPDIGGNIIDHNWNRGIYVGVGSLPNMLGKLVKAPICCVWYAVSGYNKINENGGWEPDDDGSEIYINNANAILGDIKSYGCNQITDQRIPNTEDTPPLYNTQLLIQCESWTPLQIEVHAEGNFWDEHPVYRLEERFGDCIVYSDPILSVPCLLPDGSGGKLFITSSDGEIIDTLYAEENTIGTLTETEELYATAEEKFLTSSFGDAEIIYNQIISGNDSLSVKLDAYRRLFEIGKFLGRDEEYFNDLRNTYLSLAGSTNDTLLIKIFNQLSSLSLVANQEYVPAITEFDNIVQQNPNTEEAVFAEIDALTTALMVGDGDSTLQKGTLGKYLIKSSSDYNSKLDGILRKHFGNGEKETEDEIIPTEYTLYQNYPNPFNPVTTIKYDLPNTSDVSLIIYDILGRKVKELVNTKQQAGRYEIQFDATNLASGVYIYQIIAEKYISSKKMILLK